MTPLFIILVLLHILYIILGYMFSMTSVMVYDSPNSGGIYTDFFFYSMMSTLFFAIGSTISLLYTGTYRLSLELLLTNLFFSFFPFLSFLSFLSNFKDLAGFSSFSGCIILGLTFELV